MPDNIALSTEEQKYFDTAGSEAPVTETPAAEPVKEPAASEKAPVAKKTKTIGKEAPKAKEAPAEESTEEVVETPIRSKEQEENENLKNALKEERTASRQRETLTNQRLEQLQAAILEARQPKTEPVAIPDPEKDALGALKYLMQQTREGQVQQHQTVEQQQRHQQTQHIMGEAQRLELEYLAQQPDYDAEKRTSPIYNEASNFLANQRRSELLATGAYNPVQINQILLNETLGLAENAIRAGRNPAQVVMDVAKARGFAVKPAAPVETEQQKIDRIARGQEAGFSLGQATGSKAPNNSKLDAKTLANMSDEAFTAFVEKAKKSELRGLMGD